MRQHMRRAHSASTALVVARRFMQNEPSGRDKRRNQGGGDMTTGHQIGLFEAPDLDSHMHFGTNTLSHIPVPEIDDNLRNKSDSEKERVMKAKYGELGPGERLKNNAATERRNQLKKIQDVDGLPWEVRWRKNMIPSSEEMLQDVRDRFDLFVQDPIDREREWYLHWKDRMYRMQPDRLLWPQGFTDYLDNYDANGRRRVLPNAQKWTDSSWRYLADSQYKSRMWLVEGEDRRGIHAQLQSNEQLLLSEEKRQMQNADVLFGLHSGVIDLDENQVYQALSGSADPIDVANTKDRIAGYAAEQGMADPKEVSQRPIDPISGFPKALDTRLLPSGVTIEQGAAIAGRARFQDEMIAQAGQTALNQGRDQLQAQMLAEKHMSKKSGDVPVQTRFAAAAIEATKRLQESIDGAIASGTDEKAPRLAASPLLDLFASAESNIGKQATSTAPPKKSGFMTMPVVTEEQRPRQPRELILDTHTIPLTVSSTDDSSDAPAQIFRQEDPTAGSIPASMPEWYKSQAVQNDALIDVYGTMNDPLEMQPADPRYQAKPEAASFEDDDVASQRDRSTEANAFDEIKDLKTFITPELSRGFKPLPLYEEVSATVGDVAGPSPTPQEGSELAVVTTGIDGKPLKRSERLRRERAARNKQREHRDGANTLQEMLDADIMLPTLPWEVESVSDPYRGVADSKDAVSIHRPSLEATWQVYRAFFRETMTHALNGTRATSEEQTITEVLDTIPRIRNDNVGDHPKIPDDQLDVVKLVFEGNVKQFLADMFKASNTRLSEMKIYKAEADQLLKQASAKTKLLGKGFADFVQEMIAFELENVRQNPLQRYAIYVKDQRLEPLARPYKRWLEGPYQEFAASVIIEEELLDRTVEHMKRTLGDLKAQTPMRVDGLGDDMRGATLDAFHHFCLASINRSAARFSMKMFFKHAEVRFRSKAEFFSENATEAQQLAYNIGHQFLSLPCADSAPPYEYHDSDFPGGENAFTAEVQGNYEKAEKLWAEGTTKRWYPMVDETEVMWYNERRGRYTMAMEVSDRTLENLNKRTHPSLHPFPDRARPFLDGAPLTQETAEHLWLRHMGDVYWEHGLFMNRVGRFATGHEYLQKSLGFLHLAIREAREKLPPTWKAVTLTQAKYLAYACHDAPEDPLEFLASVEEVVNKMYDYFEQAPDTPTNGAHGRTMLQHWMDPEYELPARVALVERVAPLFSPAVTQAAKRAGATVPTAAEAMSALSASAKGGAAASLTQPVEKWIAATDLAAEEVVRKRIFAWRAREIPGSDPYLYLTHLYFSIRVQPKTPEQVQTYWDMYAPVLSHIVTRASLSAKIRGSNMINDALRKICQILAPGSKEHHAILLKELTKIREKLSHMVHVQELNKTIAALEAHMVKPQGLLPYLYGSAALHSAAGDIESRRMNASLHVDLASKEYKQLLHRTKGQRDATDGNAIPASRSPENIDSASAVAPTGFKQF